MDITIEFHDPVPESQDTSVGCSIHIGDFATLHYRGAANRDGALAGAANCLSMNLRYEPEYQYAPIRKLTHLVDHYGNRHPVTFKDVSIG